MNFNVNFNYKQAVENFSWDADIAPLPIKPDDFTELVKEISKKIISTFQMKPVLEMISSKSLTLVETCYLVVQDQDRDVIDPVTISLIQEASPTEKKLLNHTVKKLSEDFIQVPLDDLKTITLLFGIQRVHDLAKGIIVEIPIGSQIEQLESSLAKLQSLRNKYDPHTLSNVEKEFLQQVDSEIAEKTELLEALKLSIEEHVM